MLRREVKKGSEIGALLHRAPATTLFIKIQFQNPLHTKDEKFCRNGWALARRFLFRSLFASPGCSLLRLLWIFCRCEKAPRVRRGQSALLFAQQLSLPRRAIFQALYHWLRNNLRKTETSYCTTSYTFCWCPVVPTRERERQDKPGLIDTHIRMENTHARFGPNAIRNLLLMQLRRQIFRFKLVRGISGIVN